MSDFLNSLSGKKPPSKPGVKSWPAKPPPNSPAKPKATFHKRDVIGNKYVVERLLGIGGFGEVYLVRNRVSRETCALKTPRDEFQSDPKVRQAFKKEALLWVNLEEHPCILSAKLVEEFSGRLFVKMDYVWMSLADHLREARGALDYAQVLKWAIQFCVGMEHATSHGMECHRDIKPANILITQDKMLKIADFGLAAAAEAAWGSAAGREGSLITNTEDGDYGFSIVQSGRAIRCGTPGYMAPEVYRGERATERSDIYSFGLVIWQMATGSINPPFVGQFRGDIEDYLREVYEQQMRIPLPNPHLRVSPINKPPLWSLIEKCTKPDPSQRFRDFDDLRSCLETVNDQPTASICDVLDDLLVALPSSGQSGIASTSDGLDIVSEIGERDAVLLSNRGASLNALGRHEAALACCAKALAIEPRLANAWQNEGLALANLGRREEALACYNKALAIEPRDPHAWGNKAALLNELGQHEKALNCADEALAVDRRSAEAWNAKAKSLAALGRHGKAISSYDKVLAIDQLQADAWYGKAVLEDRSGRAAAAVWSYGKFLELAQASDAELIAYAQKRLRELRNR